MVDLGIGNPGTVIDRGVEVAVAGAAMAMRCVIATTMHFPAPVRRDRGDLLDANMNQFAWPVALIADHGFTVLGSVTPIKTDHAFSTQDRLNGRSRHAEFVSDVISAPPASSTGPDHAATQHLWSLVR